MTDRPTGILPTPLCEHSARWLLYSGKWGHEGPGLTAGTSLAVRLEPLCLPVAGVWGTCHHAQTASWELET